MMMMEDLKALQELIRETAEKYDIYINGFSFYGKGADVTAKREGEEKFISTY